MKKSIDRKIYNTDTATLIATARASGGVSDRDFRFWRESLYISPNGQYFLEYQGGPLSKYAIQDGKTSMGDHDIRLLTPDESLKWMEDNNIQVDIISAHFPLEEG